MRAKCERMMIQAVSEENAATWIDSADRLGVQGLRDYCLAFICDGFDRISQSSAFHDLCRTNAELVIQVFTARRVDAT